MKKRIYLGSVIMLVAASIITGCAEERGVKAGESYIYYANETGTALVKEAYTLQGDSTREELDHMLQTMEEPEDSGEYQSVIPEDVAITKSTVQDDKAEIHFNDAYTQVDKAHDVLCRAAIVQSLVQIAGIDEVSFYVNDQPLMNQAGSEIGYMSSDDFVQNIGPALNSYQKVTLTLYYANEAGDDLISKTTTLRYNSNTSISKLIVEQLLKANGTDQRRATLPVDTKLLGISVKDGICYVNFDEGFQASGYELDPNLAIYSLVNSLTEEPEIEQVQISVNGETNVMFQGVVDLSQPFTRDLDAFH